MVHLFAVISELGLRLEERDGGWALAGTAASRFGLVDEYLGYLADRNYSPKTVRAYGYDLLAFCRWLVVEEQPLTEVTTEVLLRFLRACRGAKVSGRPGPNVVRLTGRRMDQYAATTINRRLAAISGLFTFATMRDPRVTNPVPRAARRAGGCPVSTVGCSPTPCADRRIARRCGFVNPADCPRRCPSRTRLSCWPASAPGATGRSRS